MPSEKRVIGFEYGAILKGSQTTRSRSRGRRPFEYGAILKGSQTWLRRVPLSLTFEYGAILKGSQTEASGITAQ